MLYNAQALVCVYTYDMSGGRWDNSPDSRNIPTVDLQWWLSSTDVFCTVRAKSLGGSNTLSHMRSNIWAPAVYLVQRC